MFDGQCFHFVAKSPPLNDGSIQSMRGGDEVDDDDDDDDDCATPSVTVTRGAMEGTNKS